MSFYTFAAVIASMAVTLVLLRFRVSIGLAILGAAALIWVCKGLSFPVLFDSVKGTLTSGITWDLVLCLYFVMCLEYEMRQSGILPRMAETLKNGFSSNKVTIAIMPAFLGLLPSVGGARFSAPFVELASAGLDTSPNRKALINYWFRHIFEFSSPIIPGLILACAIAQVSIGALILNIGWLTVFCCLIGVVFLILPIRITDPSLALGQKKAPIDWISLIFTVGPILFAFLLTVGFRVPVSIAMAVTVVLLLPCLKMIGHPVPFKEVVLKSFDFNLLASVFCILFYIEVLRNTGTLHELISGLQATGLPVPVTVALIAFSLGMLTGMTQGYVAMAVPIVAGLAPGDVTMVGLTMAFGMAGQMLTPTHLCALISIDYYKADFFKFMAWTGLLLIVMLAGFVPYFYLTH